MLFVVVLGAVSVGELDQAVVVRQPRVCLSKTPGADEENSISQSVTSERKRRRLDEILP